VLLAELALPFERDSRSWSVAEAEVLRLNPMLRVPALADTDEAGQVQLLLDSKLIVNYLYDRYPPAAPPTGAELGLSATLFSPHSRWDDENTLLVIDAAVDSAINVFLLELDGIGPAQAPYLQRQRERTARCVSWLEQRLGDGETLHPGSFGFLDIALLCALDWLTFRQRYPVADHPQLRRYSEQHRQRPSLLATHPSLASNTAPPKTTASPALR
jgi:glutathione S-transferase